jgi:hypothetical protein
MFSALHAWFYRIPIPAAAHSRGGRARRQATPAARSAPLSGSAICPGAPWVRLAASRASVAWPAQPALRREQPATAALRSGSAANSQHAACDLDCEDTDESTAAATARQAGRSPGDLPILRLRRDRAILHVRLDAAHGAALLPCLPHCLRAYSRRCAALVHCGIIARYKEGAKRRKQRTVAQARNGHP